MNDMDGVLFIWALSIWFPVAMIIARHDVELAVLATMVYILIVLCSLVLIDFWLEVKSKKPKIYVLRPKDCYGDGLIFLRVNNKEELYRFLAENKIVCNYEVLGTLEEFIEYVKKHLLQEGKKVLDFTYIE